MFVGAFFDVVLYPERIPVEQTVKVPPNGLWIVGSQAFARYVLCISPQHAAGGWYVCFLSVCNFRHPKRMGPAYVGRGLDLTKACKGGWQILVMLNRPKSSLPCDSACGWIFHQRMSSCFVARHETDACCWSGWTALVGSAAMCGSMRFSSESLC